MTEHLIILTVVWSVLAGAITALIPAKSKLLRPWALFNLLAVQVICTVLLGNVLDSGPVSYHISGWAPPTGLEYRATIFSALLSWLVSLVGLVSYLGGQSVFKEQIGERLPHFLALYFLQLASFQGLCLSNDAFNLFIMLEIASLATYGLIAFGGGRAYLATFHYIVMGSIGASFYLLGVGYLYIKTGTLNISDMARLLSGVDFTPAYLLGLGFIVTGLLLKMAVFPLHLWLPNAYTYAPDATSTLIAPLSTKLAVFLLFRVLVDIFSSGVPIALPSWSVFVVMLASFGILAGTSLALAQRDLKKIFACLIVAEAGYMLGGLWLVDARGTVGSLFHLLNDALATLGLFLLVIAVQNVTGGRNLEDARGLFRRAPIAAAALVMFAFNLIGVPPFSAFFSKFTLLTAAVASGRYEFMVALILASLGNLVIFFRILEHAFFDEAPTCNKPASEGSSSDKPAGEESKKGIEPVGILAFVVGLALIALGLSAYPVMEIFINPVVFG